MKVSVLREELQRLEREGRGDSDLYVTPTMGLCAARHRPGEGVVVGFDFSDHPVEAIDDSFCQPEDATVVFLEFGITDQSRVTHTSRDRRGPAH